MTIVSVEFQAARFDVFEPLGLHSVRQVVPYVADDVDYLYTANSSRGGVSAQKIARSRVRHDMTRSRPTDSGTIKHMF
jgi:hypothetical protein